MTPPNKSVVFNRVDPAHRAAAFQTSMLQWTQMLINTVQSAANPELSKFASGLLRKMVSGRKPVVRFPDGRTLYS